MERRTAQRVLLLLVGCCARLCAGWAGTGLALHHVVPLRVSSRAASPALSADYAAMSYRELQQACKALGLTAKGKADELRERLLSEAGGAGVAQAPALSEDDGAEAEAFDPEAEAEAFDPEAEALFAEFEMETQATEEEIEELDQMEVIDLDELELMEQEEATQAAEGELEAAVDSDADLDADLQQVLAVIGTGEGTGEITGEEGVEEASVAALSSSGEGFGDDSFWDEIEGGVPSRGAVDDASWIDDLFGPELLQSDLEEDADLLEAPQEEVSSEPLSERESLRRGITEAAREGEHAKVLTMINKWKRRRLPVEQPIYWAGLCACAAKGVWQVGSAMLNEIEASSDMDLTASHYECVLRACDKERRWQEALALLTRMRESGLRPNNGCLEATLRVCSKAKQGAMVDAVWNVLRAEMRHPLAPLTPDVRTYNTLMRSVAGGLQAHRNERQSGAKKVLEALSEAELAGIELDGNIYKHVLRACDLLGDWERAIEMLDKSREAGYSPDVLSYANAMSACARNGKHQLTLRLLAEMRNSGLQPNSFCFNSALLACAKADRMGQAMGILSEMEQEDSQVPPTTHSYGALLRSCAITGDSRHAMQLLDRMQDNNISPTAQHFALSIQAWSRANAPVELQTKRIMGMLSEMQKRAMQPDVQTFTTAMAACARVNQLNRALSLLERMYQLGVTPDVATFNVLLSACDKMGKSDELFSLIDQMPQLGVEPNIVNYNTALRGLSRSGEIGHVAEVLERMKRRKIAPVISTYRAIINGTCQAGHTEVAMGYLDQLRAEGLKPDVLIMWSLLSTCGEEARPFVEKSLELAPREASDILARGDPFTNFPGRNAKTSNRAELLQPWRGGGGRGRGGPRGSGGRGRGRGNFASSGRSSGRMDYSDRPPRQEPDYFAE